LCGLFLLAGFASSGLGIIETASLGENFLFRIGRLFRTGLGSRRVSPLNRSSGRGGISGELELWLGVGRLERCSPPLKSFDGRPLKLSPFAVVDGGTGYKAIPWTSPDDALWLSSVATEDPERAADESASPLQSIQLSKSLPARLSWYIEVSITGSGLP
jgi:hypothetical protein